MELITGSTGTAHVTPIDDAMRNTHMASSDRESDYGQVVFDVPHNASADRRAFNAEVLTANEIRVYSGYGSNQGRLFKIPENSYDSVTIDNGRSGAKRVDLISARYTMDTENIVESMELYVIKGEFGTDYVEPTPIAGNINSGDLIDDFVLYKVYINGMAIDHIEKCFTPLPDGGLIGVAMNLMNEVKAQLELVPFDLGDAVNRAYVDTEIGRMNNRIGVAKNSMTTLIGNLMNGCKLLYEDYIVATTEVGSANGTLFQADFDYRDYDEIYISMNNGRVIRVDCSKLDSMPYIGWEDVQVSETRELFDEHEVAHNYELTRTIRFMGNGTMSTDLLTVRQHGQEGYETVHYSDNYGGYNSLLIPIEIRARKYVTYAQWAASHLN